MLKRDHNKIFQDNANILKDSKNITALIASQNLNNNLCNILAKNPQTTLNNLSTTISDDEKALFLRNLLENSSDNVMRSIVEKCLDKYNLKLEDINLSINCKKLNNGNQNNIFPNQIPNTQNNNNNFQTTKIPSSMTIFANPNNNSNNNLNNNINTIQTNSTGDPTSNLASPTSILSTTDRHIENNNCNNQAHLLNYKRKRSDSTLFHSNSLHEQQINNNSASKQENPIESNTDLNLNQKEKENMFEEVNELTPHLISDPMNMTMSPPRFKKM